MRAIAPLLLVCLTLTWLAGAPGAQEARKLRLVQWSDIHSGGEHYVPQAWQEALREGLAWQPQGIVSTGDCGDNSEDPAGWAHRMQVFLAEMAGELGDARIPVFHCLGNNDLRENYQSDPDLLEQTEGLFRGAFKDSYYLDRLGNGVHPVHLGGFTWISLNSNIFCSKNHYSGADQQARQSLDWLQSELKGSGPVVLLMHIPPTVDLYDNLPAWRAGSQRRLQEILQAYPGWVGILAGHYHRNEVHALRRPQGSVPILVAGSLSSKYRYAPNWRTSEWTLGDGGAPQALDYEVRYPGHPDWTEAYRVRDLDRFVQSLEHSPGFYARYMRDLFAHVPDYQSHSQNPTTRTELLQQFWL